MEWKARVQSRNGKKRRKGIKMEGQSIIGGNENGGRGKKRGKSSY